MTLTPITHSQSFNDVSQIKPPAPTPALLNTKCGAPNLAKTACPMASTSAALEISKRKDMTCPPYFPAPAVISAVAVSSASCCTSTKTMFMPSLTPMRAHSKPKPEPAPVKTAVLFLKWEIILFLTFLNTFL